MLVVLFREHFAIGSTHVLTVKKLKICSRVDEMSQLLASIGNPQESHNNTNIYVWPAEAYTPD